MKIVKDEVINEIIIEKSRFITYLKRVDSVDEANEYLLSIKKKHYDSTHQCYALIINDIMRSNDNGEPSGTAGIPILEVLKKNEINNTICIVVRYFGGVKLGAGGLVRAYSSSCSEALKKASFLVKKEFKRYELLIDYSTYNNIIYLIKDKIISNDFTHNVKLIIDITDDSIIEKIKDISLGNALVKYLETVIKDVSI
ncbi:MAG: YigZ family protein [Acholeplasmatales bacterium]|nr:YigZ family protein [Acholeplasmatales bacterium]